MLSQATTGRLKLIVPRNRISSSACAGAASAKTVTAASKVLRIDALLVGAEPFQPPRAADRWRTQPQSLAVLWRFVLLSRFAPRAGFVCSRQRFVRWRHALAPA